MAANDACCTSKVRSDSLRVTFNASIAIESPFRAVAGVPVCVLSPTDDLDTPRPADACYNPRAFAFSNPRESPRAVIHLTPFR